MEEQSPYYRTPPPPPMPGSPPPMPMYLAPGHGYAPVVSADDRSMGMICHLLAILTGFIGPVIIWLVKKQTSPFLDHHGREALNFQITVFLASLVLGSMVFVLMFVGIGFFLLPLLIVLPILALVAEIIACAAANRGEWHRYPCCIRLL